MKMKEIVPRGGAHVPGSPAPAWICQVLYSCTSHVTSDGSQCSSAEKLITFKFSYPEMPIVNKLTENTRILYSAVLTPELS